MTAPAPETGHAVWPTLSQARLAPIVAREITRRDGRVEAFLAEKGDVLIWHGRLLHRGSRARRPGAERRALIAHYNAAARRPDIERRADGNGCLYGYWPNQVLVWKRDGKDGAVVVERREGA